MSYDPLKPSYQKSTRQWCKTIKGKRYYLGTDIREAKRRLAEIVQDRARRQAMPLDGKPLQDVIDAFLEHVEATKKANTFQTRRWRLKRVTDILGATLRVCDLKRYHASQLEKEMWRKEYSSTSIADTLGALVMALRWAVSNELLERNPLDGIKKPKSAQRSRILTDVEFRSLVRGSHATFRRVLFALRWTGCRPCELRELTWSDVHIDVGLWILRDHKTATLVNGKPPRLIALSARAKRLCVWIQKSTFRKFRIVASDHVFLNASGRPWSKDALCRALSRARDRAGLGKDVVLYTNRHTFATAAAGKIGDLELAALLGHTSTRTTSRYVHLNAERLREIVAKLG